VYKLPEFEKTVSTLYSSNYYGTLDMESGFWHVKLAEADREKTGFSTSSRSYCYLSLPLGIDNPPSSFQRLMAVVIKELKGQECWILLDGSTI
jgi:hypothetical protein